MKKIIVINQKAGILCLPYSEKGRMKYQDFMPGKNEVDAEVLEAVKEANSESWEHYSRHLKEEVEVSGEVVDISVLTVNEAKTIVENTMSVSELEGFMASEGSGKNRKGVKDAIEAQIEILDTKKTEE